MRFCKKTTIPECAVNVIFDDDGISSTYKSNIEFKKLSPEVWEQRKKKFEKILEDYKSDSNYDCLIGVSGGKDSYFQTHLVCKEYNLKPLLVTYHGNNFLPEADGNRDRMRKVFDIDHLVVGPSVEALKKLNRIGFEKIGDMNWQNHCGITTYVFKIAVAFKIPLVMWGETAWDVAGMYKPDDFVEFNIRSRNEHDLRGFEWDDILNSNDPRNKLSKKDLIWAKFPTDKQINDVGVRGIYMGNYFKWDHYKQTDMLKEYYGWEEARQPFERTYRKVSNLDDRYENGIHDYLKFVKFGYGRGTDHSTKDILSGYMTRDEGVEMVKKYDHIVSSDLEYWCKYVDYKEEDFFRIADKFRDPRVWWIEDDKWFKHNIWGGCSSYGKVLLTKEEKLKFLEKQKKYQDFRNRV